jgi:hypothetical protein
MKSGQGDSKFDIHLKDWEMKDTIPRYSSGSYSILNCQRDPAEKKKLNLMTFERHKVIGKSSQTLNFTWLLLKLVGQFCYII